jgi:L-2,4-diaminobutyric acid acetyltransferase
MESSAPRPETAPRGGTTLGFELRIPRATDGLVLWRLAGEAGGLDVNSPYSYQLWCRDFASTSVLAWCGRAPAGFVTGYRRPDAPDRLFVWQVAVDPTSRGRGLGVAMLDHLVGRDDPPRWMEATVTPSNRASQRMFERLAARHDVPVARMPFLDADDFPEQHEAEILLEIGPFPRLPTTSTPEPGR